MSRHLRRLHETAVGRITFPLSNALFNRRRILPTYRQMMANETLAPEQLRALQVERLRGVVSSANRWVPFYRRRFADAGLTPADIRSVADLAGIPPLTREDLAENLSDLIDERQKAAFEKALESDRRGEPIPFALFRRRRLVRNSTSGSTGSPVITFEDGSLSALSWAAEMRCKKWFGLEPGAREVRFRRAATQQDSVRLNQLRQALWNQLALPGYGLTDADQLRNLDELNRFRPAIVWGNPSALVPMAECARQKKPLQFRPRLAITWAEPLLEGQKSLLEQTFACPAANIYGSREVGHLAVTCPEGALHVNQDFYLAETGPAISKDCPGELLVTPLISSPLPLIRYQVGDLAELQDHTCPCGRPLQVMGRLEGRSADRFVTTGGRPVSSAFWPNTFSQAPGCLEVRRFQTVYRADGGLRFLIVRRENYSRGVEDFVRGHVRKHLEEDLSVEFEYVDEIRPGPSGKIPLVVDEREG